LSCVSAKTKGELCLEESEIGSSGERKANIRSLALGRHRSPKPGLASVANLRKT
jgi:hypothetical protein